MASGPLRVCVWRVLTAVCVYVCLLRSSGSNLWASL